MTLVACHYPDLGPNALQLHADTRISGTAGTITDAGPKIFAVPILVRSLSDCFRQSVSRGLALPKSLGVCPETLNLIAPGELDE